MPATKKSSPAAEGGTAKKKNGGAKASRKSAGQAIAITGVSGFLGGNLLSHLRGDPRFERVVVLDINKPTLPIRKTKFYKTDLTEPNCDARIAEIFEKENVRHVIHLAFLRNPQRNNTFAHEFEVIGTLHLLHACAEKKIEKFVTVTTTFVYGARPDNPNFLTEEMPLRPKHSFGHIANKAEAEEIIQRFAEKNPRTCVSVLRPCLTLGPQRRNYITRFFSRPAIPTVLGYDPLLQFVHENDVFDALRLVVEKDFPGIYNIVGDGVLPLSTILKIGGKWNLAQPSFVLYPAIGALWLAGGSEIPPEFVDYLRYLCIADGTRAREKLGFSPRHSTKDTWHAFTGEERLRQFL